MVVLGAMALLMLAVAALFMTAAREDVSFPPDSAEAAFQGYMTAWSEGDTATAYDALSSHARSLVPYRDFAEAQSWSDDDATRVWIDSRHEEAERVILKLTIERPAGGLLGPRTERDHPNVTLVREDGAWKIDTPLVGYYPW